MSRFTLRIFGRTEVLLFCEGRNKMTMPISVLVALIAGLTMAMYFVLRPLKIFSEKEFLISQWRRIQRRGFWFYWAAAEGSVVAVDFATVGEVGEPTFTYNRDSVRKFALVRRQALPSPAHTG